MQIRLLGFERQSALRGNVVNIENDLDICAKVLPRKFDETSTVQVQLMRRMTYKSPYMYETIRPKKVYDAAIFLLIINIACIISKKFCYLILLQKNLVFKGTFLNINLFLNNYNKKYF